jgi:hypothetical protein
MSVWVGISPLVGAGSLDGFAVGATVSGVLFLAITAPRWVRRRQAAAPGTSDVPVSVGSTAAGALEAGRGSFDAGSFGDGAFRAEAERVVPPERAVQPQPGAQDDASQTSQPGRDGGTAAYRSRHRLGDPIPDGALPDAASQDGVSPSVASQDAVSPSGAARDGVFPGGAAQEAVSPGGAPRDGLSLGSVAREAVSTGSAACDGESSGDAVRGSASPGDAAGDGVSLGDVTPGRAARDRASGGTRRRRGGFPPSAFPSWALRDHAQPDTPFPDVAFGDVVFPDGTSRSLGRPDARRLPRHAAPTVSFVARVSGRVLGLFAARPLAGGVPS